MTHIQSTGLPGLGLDATLAFDNNLVFSGGYTVSEAISWSLYPVIAPGTYLETQKTISFIGGYRFEYNPKLVFDCMAGLSASTARERVVYGSETVPNGWFTFARPLYYEQITTQFRPELRARAHWLFTRYTGLHVGCGALLDRPTVTYLQLGFTFGKLR